MTGLPEYSDDPTNCRACANYSAATEYMPSIVGVRHSGGHLWPSHEFLKRTCERCGYEWAEACLEGLVSE